MDIDLVEEFMTTDLFTVIEDDLVEYVANIMDWRNIRHLLVENDDGQLFLVVCVTCFGSVIWHIKLT